MTEKEDMSHWTGHFHRTAEDQHFPTFLIFLCLATKQCVVYLVMFKSCQQFHQKRNFLLNLLDGCIINSNLQRANDFNTRKKNEKQ